MATDHRPDYTRIRCAPTNPKRKTCAVPSPIPLRYRLRGLAWLVQLPSSTPRWSAPRGEVFMQYLVGFLFVFALFMMGCGDGGGVCESFCAKDFECYSPQERIPRCEEACRYELGVAGDLSAECGDAAVSVFACVADLQTCEEVDNYWYEIPADSYPCKAADDAAESACLVR